MLRRRAVLAALLSTACGGDDALEWEGVAGRPVPASFDQWVPGVSASAAGVTRHVLLDSGAPLTLLDTDEFTGLDDGAHEVDVAIGELTFPSLEVAAYDVISYEQSRSPPIGGLIGGDILTAFAFSLDYKDGRVWLEDEPAARPEGVAPGSVDGPLEVRARVSGGGVFPVPGGDRVDVGATRFLVWAEAEDLTGEDGFWVLVDTGASSVFLSHDVVERLSGDRPRLEGVTVGTANGPQPAYFTRVWSMRLDAGEAEDPVVDLPSVPALVLEDDSVFDAIESEVNERVLGIVGGTYLRWFVATLDYPRETLRLLPYTAPDHIDEDEFVGVGFTFELRDSEWTVDTVYPGTDADADGLRSGDELVAVAGVEVDGLSYAEVDGLFGDYSLGDQVPVTVDGSGGLVEVEIAVEDLLPDLEAP